MICPVELANEVSDFGGVGLVLFVEAHGALLGNRSGPGDESTRSDYAGDEWRDRVVSGSGVIGISPRQNNLLSFCDGHTRIVLALNK
jgi:hypothetical protein